MNVDGERMGERVFETASAVVETPVEMVSVMVERVDSGLG